MRIGHAACLSCSFLPLVRDTFPSVLFILLRYAGAYIIVCLCLQTIFRLLFAALVVQIRTRLIHVTCQCLTMTCHAFFQHISCGAVLVKHYLTMLHVCDHMLVSITNVFRL